MNGLIYVGAAHHFGILKSPQELPPFHIASTHITPLLTSVLDIYLYLGSFTAYCYFVIIIIIIFV